VARIDETAQERIARMLDASIGEIEPDLDFPDPDGPPPIRFSANEPSISGRARDTVRPVRSAAKRENPA
jgi:hypothetical protein